MGGKKQYIDHFRHWALNEFNNNKTCRNLSVSFDMGFNSVTATHLILELYLCFDTAMGISLSAPYIPCWLPFGYAWWNIPEQARPRQGFPWQNQTTCSQEEAAQPGPVRRRSRQRSGLKGRQSMKRQWSHMAIGDKMFNLNVATNYWVKCSVLELDTSLEFRFMRSEKHHILSVWWTMKNIPSRHCTKKHSLRIKSIKPSRNACFSIVEFFILMGQKVLINFL